MAWFFWFFFVSGFCSVLCELIWLRLSMAQFGGVRHDGMGTERTPEQQLSKVLSHPTTPDAIIAHSPATPALTDDRPINEYYLLRTPFDELMAME